jgi:hypothetical protein
MGEIGPLSGMGLACGSHQSLLLWVFRGTSFDRKHVRTVAEAPVAEPKPEETCKWLAGACLLPSCGLSISTKTELRDES